MSRPSLQGRFAPHIHVLYREVPYILYITAGPGRDYPPPAPPLPIQNRVIFRYYVYHIVMKYIFLAIFVLFAAQPFRASFCDMHESPEPPHSGHDMQSGPMVHDDGSAMDCCDHDPSTPVDDCETMSDCGACTPAVLAIVTFPLVAFYHSDTTQYFSDTGGPVNSFSSPPFRPPIS
jgi:hypothetical protein